MHKSTKKLALSMLMLALLVVGQQNPAAALEPAETQSPVNIRADVNRITAPAQTAQPPQAIKQETIKCPMTLPEGEIDGKTIVCGHIIVPANWEVEDGDVMTITYAIAKSFSQAPFADPIIYFEGGPGGTALEDIESLNDEFFSQFRRTRDFIYYDQRGTRYSSDLNCPFEVQYPQAMQPITMTEAVTSTGEVDIDEIRKSLPPPPSLNDDPLVLLDQERAKGPLDIISNCNEYFKQKGTDLTAYSTANSVKDAVALLTALKYPRYNLYGVSYGTTVALELLRYYDQHTEMALPALRSTVIDGVFPIYADPYEQALLFPDIVLGMFDACEADEECSKAYPNIRQRFIDLLAKIEKTPLKVDENTTIALDDLIDVLGSVPANENKSAVSYVPRMIDELERGEATIYLRLKEGSLPVATAESDEDSNLFDPIAKQVKDLSEETRKVADQISAITEQSRRITAALSQGVTPAQLFAEEFARSMESMPFTESMFSYYAAESATFGEPTREAIQNLLTLAQEKDKPLLQSILNLMKDDDIAETFLLLRQPGYLGRLTGVNSITNYVVDCNDRYAPLDIAKSFETFRAYPAPQLINDPLKFAPYQVGCEAYGLTSPPAPLPDPVTSTVRTLVSNGTYDANTSVAFGELAFKSLQNAVMVTYPMSVHGASVQSQCAKDITYAFFMYPDEELNLNCVETMKPTFVLPDEALPEAP